MQTCTGPSPSSTVKEVCSRVGAIWKDKEHYCISSIFYSWKVLLCGPMLQNVNRLRTPAQNVVVFWPLCTCIKLVSPVGSCIAQCICCHFVQKPIETDSGFHRLHNYPLLKWVSAIIIWLPGLYLEEFSPPFPLYVSTLTYFKIATSDLFRRILTTFSSLVFIINCVSSICQLIT